MDASKAASPSIGTDTSRQPMKAPGPYDCTEAGGVAQREEQPTKAHASMCVTESGKSTCSSDEHSAKAILPMIVTEPARPARARKG